MVDNLITLYEANATVFNTNGLGSLNKATSCVVIEKRNGEYELELVYPVGNIDEEVENDPSLLDSNREMISDYSGNDVTIMTRPVAYEELQFNRIIFTKPNPYATPQPFRIYAISKPIDGLITVNAQHISYDLSGVSVSPFSADTVVYALQQIKSHAVGNCPFTFWTDKTNSGNMHTTYPVSMRSILGGSEGSVLDVYGGEYEFDKFRVKLHNHRGMDRGVTIRYGKNLTDIRQDENCGNMYTAVYPYWYSEDENGVGVLVELDEKIVRVDGTFNHEKILTVDMTEYFDEKPTKNELRYATQLYINAYNIGVPDISLTVSFVPLSDTEEYKNYSLLEQVSLCDTVTVEFPKLNISATAKCIQTKYDVLTNKYISIELGNARSDLSTSFASYDEAISELPTKTFLEQAIENATNLITGQDGGYVVLNPANQPRELLVMDQPDIESATRVWRWNAGGLGYSSNGYNGPYSLAMTMDGSIVADFINTGTLNASLIKTGLLTDFNNNNYWNLTTGRALFTNLKVKQSLSLVDTNGFTRANIGYDSTGNSSSLRFYDGVNQPSLIYIGTGLNNSQPQIALGDQDGDIIVNTFKSSTGGVLNLNDLNGQRLATIKADEHGGALQLLNNVNGSLLVNMFANTYGGGQIRIGNQYGMTVASMMATDAGGRIYISNDDGTHQIVTLYANSTDGGALALGNNVGTTMISMTANTSESNIALSDGNGNQLVTLTANSVGGNLNVNGNIWGNYQGKKWVRTYDYFENIAVDSSWGAMYCSAEQRVDYTALGITTVDNVFISLVTMDGGMWAWPVNTKQDSTYIYYVLTRPTSDTCEKVKVSILIIGN